MVLMLLTGLMSAHSLFAQEVHRIVLNIDTKNIVPENTLSWAVSENTTVLNPGDNGIFTIFARVGDEIHWEAKSLTDSEVPVRFLALNYLGGPRIFSRNQIEANDYLMATVIRAGKENYIYQLKYQIGKEPKQHTITGQIRTGE